jgi:hypothetical protein
MSKPDDGDEPLDPTLATLFAAERARPAPKPSPDAIARIDRLGESPPPPDRDEHLSDPSRASSRMARASWARGAMIFAAGVASGAGFHAAWRGAQRTPVRVEIRERVREVIVTSEAGVAPDAPATDATVDATSADAAAAGSHPSDDRAARSDGGAARGDALTQETTLMTRAQNALARGQPAAAIDASARAGDANDARTRAARFRETYPRSPLLPVVDTVVRSLVTP